MRAAAERARNKSGRLEPEPEPAHDAPLHNSLGGTVGLPTEIECPECAEVIKARAKVCRFCQARIESPKQREKRERKGRSGRDRESGEGGSRSSGRHRFAPQKKSPVKIAVIVVAALGLAVGAFLGLRPEGMKTSALLAPRLKIMGKWGTKRLPGALVVSESSIRMTMRARRSTGNVSVEMDYRWLDDTAVWVSFPDGGKRVKVGINPDGKLIFGDLLLEPWDKFQQAKRAKLLLPKSQR